MPDFAPYPMVTPFPEEERRHQETPDITTGHNVSTADFSPRQLEVLESRHGLTGEKIDYNAEVRKQADEQAKIRVAEANREAAELQRQEQERANAVAKAQGEIDTWSTRLREARDKFEKAPPVTLFHEGDTWNNVLKGVSLAVGAIGGAMATVANARLGGGGQGPNVVKNLIDMDLGRQREAIAKLSDNAAMAKTGLADALDARKMLLAEVDARGALAWKRIGGITKAALAAQGLKQPEIDQHKANLEAKEEEQKYKESAVAPLTKKIEDTFGKRVEGDTVTTRTSADKGKQPTERQTTDAFLGTTLSRMLDVIEKNPELDGATLSKVQAQELAMQAADDTARKSQLGGLWVKLQREITGTVPKSKTEGLSDSDQTSIAAGDIAKEMVARKLSGGAIVTDEDRANAEKYMIHAGDSPELRAFKLMNLRNMAKDMIGLSGKAGEIISPTAEPAAAKAAPRTGGNSMEDLAKDAAKNGGVVHGTRDMRNDPDAQPGVSPPGPPTETPANDPDDPNNTAALPEDPNAASIDDLQPKKGVEKATAPKISPVPPPKESPRAAAIRLIKKIDDPKRKAMLMKAANPPITEQELR